MNNQEYNKFLGMLYDILISDSIIKYKDEPRDLKEKRERLERDLGKLEHWQQREQELGIDSRLKRIRELYYDRYIIKESDIPDKYFKSLQQQYFEEGYGRFNLVNPQTKKEKRLREAHIQTVIRGQKDSLDNWLNYFFSDDSSYLEMWAKVWAFQGMLQIGNVNKSKDGYERRSNTTVNPFVSFDSEILGRCVELVKETFEKKELTDAEVKKLVSNGSFSKLYGMLLANKKQIKAETTEGIWIKYNRETEDIIKEKLTKGLEPEYIKLYNSLQGYNTGWCTAGARDTAKYQILVGDFYVYYSKDKEGQYKIPRLAIRMNGENIGEVRGIDTAQNIELSMKDILEEKLKEFPDSDMYKKTVSDMKTLTIIYNKYLKDEELTKEELRFLYEFDDYIMGFGGYRNDPRIKDILHFRDKRKDFALIFNLNEENICFDKKNISDNQIYYDGHEFICRFDSITKIEIPQFVRSVYLNDLTSAKDLNLPPRASDVYLNGLTSAEGLNLPPNVIIVELNGLGTLKDLILPNNECIVRWKGNSYTASEIKEMQERQKEKYSFRPSGQKPITSLLGIPYPNTNGKSRGVITSTLLIANLLLFGILVFIIILLIIK